MFTILLDTGRRAKLVKFIVRIGRSWTGVAVDGDDFGEAGTSTARERVETEGSSR